jgi:putative ABC transport system permease protein
MDAGTFRIAWRALWRDRAYTLLNLAGLSLAIGCCLILGAWVRSELTYDLQHAKHDRIFRVTNEFTSPSGHGASATTSMYLGPMLAADSAELGTYVRFYAESPERFIRRADRGFYWSDVFVADANVFDVFTHRILRGDPATALREPTSAAVSRRFAERYFGAADPLGQEIELDNGEVRRITLEFENLPRNTHLKYDVLLAPSAATFFAPTDDAQRSQRLFQRPVYTYLLLPEGYDPSRFAVTSEAFFARHMADVGRERRMTWRAWLEPLASIHLYSDAGNDRPKGNRWYLLGVLAVGAFTLLVAAINYMNLATARAVKRAKEVGMRKILGSPRAALIAQFLAESLVLALGAAAAGFGLAKLAAALTPIGELLGTPVSLGIAESLALLPFVAALVVAVGIGAGLYPALYLSAAAPAHVLVAPRSGGARNKRVREGLVVLQFAISTAVIACTLVMASQLRYLANRPLGYERDNRVAVTLHGVDTITQSAAIRTELLRNPNVLGVTWSNRLIGASFDVNAVQLEGDGGKLEPTDVAHLVVGPDFLNVMGITLVEGRDFGPDEASETITGIIVNEALVRRLHWDHAVGRRFTFPPSNHGTIIGVVKDFNFRSLHDPLAPFALYRLEETFAGVPASRRGFLERTVLIEVANHDLRATLDSVRSTLQRFDSEHPLDIQFLDDVLSRQYLSEQNLARLIGALAALCIFIACLGLFGLAAYTTSQRTREIGLRKVLGATTAQIVALLARRTVMLVIAASLLGSVAAYLAMDTWLAAFAFRTRIDPLIFVVASATGLGIAYATVALQSLRAGRAHPVAALRHD